MVFRKFFCFAQRSGERKRWAGLSPAGRQLKFKVRIFVKKSSDFNQKAPPIFKIRILGDCCLALASLGLGIYHDFIRIFEIQKQFLPAQTEVRTNLFLSPSAKGKVIILNILTAK